MIIGPLHEKTNNMTVFPAKTQIGLGIHPVWSEFSLSTWRKLGSLATHRVHSEDSYQTGRMPRLIWVFAGCTCHFVGFATRCLKGFFSVLNKKQNVFLWRKWKIMPFKIIMKYTLVFFYMFSGFLIQMRHLSRYLLWLWLCSGSDVPLTLCRFQGSQVRPLNNALSKKSCKFRHMKILL